LEVGTVYGVGSFCRLAEWEHFCRLDRLREVVPHPERANTAAFLETVIEYVTTLKNKIAVLEAQLQAAGAQPAGEMVASATVVQAPAAEV
jgi:hypothetical protein